MCFTELSISFWGHALETATHVLKKVRSKSVFSTLYEIRRDRKTNLKYLKIWSYPAYVNNTEGHELSARSDKCKFVSYLHK